MINDVNFPGGLNADEIGEPTTYSEYRVEVEVVRTHSVVVEARSLTEAQEKAPAEYERTSNQVGSPFSTTDSVGQPRYRVTSWSRL